MSPSVLSTPSYAPLQYGQHSCPKIICSQHNKTDVCSFNHFIHFITKSGCGAALKGNLTSPCLSRPCQMLYLCTAYTDLYFISSTRKSASKRSTFISVLNTLCPLVEEQGQESKAGTYYRGNAFNARAAPSSRRLLDVPCFV